MALWGKTDADASIPKFLTDAQKEKAVFVSIDEAQLETNKAKGLTNAGWWLVDQYTDSSGQTRYKSECLVAMSVSQLVAGDAANGGDDAIVADTEVTITISQQPGTAYIWAQSTTASFEVVASATDDAALTYQWLTQATGGTDEWTEIDGATGATLDYVCDVPADYGREFKVVIASANGAVKVESDVAKALED